MLASDARDPPGRGYPAAAAPQLPPSPTSSAPPGLGPGPPGPPYRPSLSPGGCTGPDPPALPPAQGDAVDAGRGRQLAQLERRRPRGRASAPGRRPRGRRPGRGTSTRDRSAAPSGAPAPGPLDLACSGDCKASERGPSRHDLPLGVGGVARTRAPDSASLIFRQGERGGFFRFWRRKSGPSWGAFFERREGGYARDPKNPSKRRRGRQLRKICKIQKPFRSRGLDFAEFAAAPQASRKKPFVHSTLPPEPFRPRLAARAPLFRGSGTAPGHLAHLAPSPWAIEAPPSSSFSNVLPPSLARCSRLDAEPHETSAKGVLAPC